ncbi:tRNA uridine-5-carboxymethylaminomethyl(34) synthesis GTPase MnmE, partial [Vibrio cholerae]|nr:tRNA uridine-5-carboxymethylaminomethyl(34) synthesis GTPase MnmE [Vibrio cholerae]
AEFTAFWDAKQELIDQGIALFFKGPHSFTGEDVIEFQCHGGPVIIDRLIETALAWGARLARPGEFSERAFLNDKIDLVQAEAISDLIA